MNLIKPLALSMRLGWRVSCQANSQTQSDDGGHLEPIATIVIGISSGNSITCSATSSTQCLLISLQDDSDLHANYSPLNEFYFADVKALGARVGALGGLLRLSILRTSTKVNTAARIKARNSASSSN